MRRLVLPFLVAVLAHLFFLRSCIIESGPPVVSIVNQQIAVTLGQNDPREEGKQKFQQEDDQEVELEVVKPQPVESPPEHPSEKNEKIYHLSDVQQIEIKENNTRNKSVFKAASQHENMQEKPLVKKNETSGEEEATSRDEAVDAQSSDGLSAAEKIVDGADKKMLAGRVIEAVPLYRRNPPPVYPRQARRRGYEGVVVLEVLVSREGQAADVKILTSSGHGLLDRAAIKAVREWRFDPGRRGEQEIDMWVQVPIRFQLTDNK